MNRIGFHYFPDSNHYQQRDLETWLPRLQELGVGWLVLQAPVARALPESFIRGLLQAGIEPVLHFQIPAGGPPPADDLQLLFKAYGRWGVRYITLFDRPNLRASWNGSLWTQSDLVERFLDRYLPLAEGCLQAELTPVFPPLEPGGDYWDTAFLHAALEGIQRRGYQAYLEKCVVGAYAWGEKPMDWGAGGPERWPGTHPYFTPPGEQDQRGFRIFDWYNTIIQSVLMTPRPIFLFALGCPPDSAQGYKEHTRKNMLMARLLAGEQVQGLEPLPDEVLAGAFWLLSASQGDPYASQAWLQPNGDHLPVVPLFRKWAQDQVKEASTSPKGVRPIAHYLLLPTYEGGVTDSHLEAIQPFIKKYKPTIGFSLQEAGQAKRITVIGGEGVYPEDELSKLRASGCIVERVEGDGTTLASNLAKKL
jgi:hypothetical protein